MTRTYTVTSSGRGAALTVAEALARAVRGDVLVFRKGDYDPFVVGPGKAGVTFDGTRGAHIKGDAASTHGILIYKADDVTVKGFDVSHVGKGSGIVAFDADDAFIFRNTVHDNTGHGIALNRSSGALVSRNLVEDNAAGSDRYHAYSGISDYRNDGEANTIRANVVRGNINERGQHTDGFGVLKDGGAGGVAIEYNRITGNGNAGIGAVDSPGGLEITGNRITGNGQDPARKGKITAEIYLRNVQGAEIDGNKVAAPEGHYAVVSSGAARNTADWQGNWLWGGLHSQGNPHHDMPGAGDNHLGVLAAELQWVL